MIRNILKTITPASINQSSRFPMLLAAILLLAAVIRVWHISAIFTLPLFNDLIIDSKMYDDWAMLIAKGNWLGSNKAFYMDPLYPYLLAVQYYLFGNSLLIARLVQVILGVGICSLLGLIGRRIGGNTVGLLSALLAALYQPLVFEGGEIEKTVLGVFLITAALYCATCKSTVSRFAAGAFLALATLCRGNLLLLVPLSACFFLLDSKRSTSEGVNEDKKCLRASVSGKSARDTLAFMLGFLLLLSPVLLRNHYVSGEWVLTTSQMGANFYTGNNPENSFGGYHSVSFVRPLPEFEENDFHLKAEELAGKKMTVKEVSSFWFHEALTHIRNNPSFASMVFLRKAVLFWGDFEVPDGWSLYFIRKYSPALCFSLFTFGWIVPFALIGATTSSRNWRVTRLLSGFVAAYFLSVIAFFVFSRYRIYVVPPLTIFAALGINWLWNRLLEKNWPKLLPALLAIFAVALFSFYGPATFGYTQEFSVHNYVHLAQLYQKKGDYKSAAVLLHEAVQLQPLSAVALCALGELRLNIGDLDGAVNYLRRCLDANPNYPDAWEILGTAYERQNKYQAAQECFEMQLRILPGHQEARNNLDRLLRN